MSGSDDEPVLDEVLSVMRTIESHFRGRAGAEARRKNLTPRCVLRATTKAWSRASTSGWTKKSRKKRRKQQQQQQQHARASPRRHAPTLLPGGKWRNHSPQRHSCPLCNKTFPWLYSLKRHMRCHKGDKVYKCHFCDYVTTSKSALHAHERSHDTGPYRCHVCEAELASKKGLLRHINHVHGYPVAKQDTSELDGGKTGGSINQGKKHARKTLKKTNELETVPIAKEPPQNKA